MGTQPPVIPGEIRPFPIDIRASVEKALRAVPPNNSFAVLARKDNQKMLAAVRYKNGNFGFVGYLEKEYQYPITYGVEVVYST